MAARKITARYLRWVTDRYFARYMTSSAHLRRLLLNKVRKTLYEHGGEEAPAIELVDAEIERLQKAGVLDDPRYATDLARTLSKRGQGSRKIRSKMAEKGMFGEVVDDAIAALDEGEGDPELRAAATFARKRRIGPWRRGELNRQKELGKLGRAGFSYGIAQRVIDAEDEDAILEEY